ncbi:type II toxin-antitoxin system PemK/MazF family toxin [Arcanobacterium hippocoleae]
MGLKETLMNFSRRYGKSIFRSALRKAEKELRRRIADQKDYRWNQGTSSEQKPHNPSFAANANRAPNSNRQKPVRNLYSPEMPNTNAHPVKWDLAKYGLPQLTYTPDNDNLPDPGEVVWTWVPYEELDGRGKDRPVLVVAMEKDYIFFLQMTSKDHASGKLYKDEHGRWWIDIGSGEWDKAGRASEVRLDLLWIVHASQVRRQGGKLDAARYRKLAQALQQIHG